MQRKLSKTEFVARVLADQERRAEREREAKYSARNYIFAMIEKHYKLKHRNYWKGRKIR